MARIAYVEEATAPLEVAELFAEIKRRRGGKLANSFRLMAHRPRLLEPFFSKRVLLSSESWATRRASHTHSATWGMWRTIRATLSRRSHAI